MAKAWGDCSHRAVGRERASDLLRGFPCQALVFACPHPQLPLPGSPHPGPFSHCCTDRGDRLQIAGDVGYSFRRFILFRALPIALLLRPRSRASVQRMPGGTTDGGLGEYSPRAERGIRPLRLDASVGWCASQGACGAHRLCDLRSLLSRWGNHRVRSYDGPWGSSPNSQPGL